MSFDDDFYDGFLDLDGDSKITLDEEFLAFSVLEDIERSESDLAGKAYEGSHHNLFRDDPLLYAEDDETDFSDEDILGSEDFDFFDAEADEDENEEAFDGVFVDEIGVGFNF